MKKNKLPKTILEKISVYPKFYRKVWLACAEIPAGEVRSYGWLAKKVGSPKAARAVGQAMAKNPFAPTVPCHRVVAANGAMTGYSGKGGIKMKIKLLKEEGFPKDP